MAIKLNKIQMEALARRISSEIISEAVKHNDAITNSEEYKKFAETNEDCLLVKELRDTYHFDVYYCNAIIGSIKSTYFKDKFASIPKASADSILDDIIIETIECDDIEVITKKIIEKYKRG